MSGRPQIHLSFAGACNTPEQKFRARWGTGQGLDCSGLGFRQGRPVGRSQASSTTFGGSLKALHQAPSLQALEDGATEASLTTKIPQGHWPAMAPKVLKQLLLPLGEGLAEECCIGALHQPDCTAWPAWPLVALAKPARWQGTFQSFEEARVALRRHACH